MANGGIILIDTRNGGSGEGFAAGAEVALRQIGRGEQQRPYADYADFAERMMAENPRLTAERAEFLVQHWGKEEDDGTVVRRADPAHKVVRPTPNRYDELLACWREITAQVLFIEGTHSRLAADAKRNPEVYQERLAAFRMTRDEIGRRLDAFLDTLQ